MNVGEVVASITAKLDGLKSGMAEAKNLFSNNMNGMKTAASSLNPTLQTMDNGVKNTSNTLKQLGESNQAAKNAMNNFDSSLKSTAINVENLDKKQQLWVVNNKSSASALELSDRALETNKLKLSELASQIDKGKTSLISLKDTLGSSSVQYKSTENAVMDLEIKYKSLTNETKILENENKQLQASANPGFFTRMKSSIVGVKDSTAEAGETVRNAGEKTKTSIIGSAQSLIAWSSATIGSAMGAYRLADSASNLGEAQNVVEQTYKSSAKSIEDWTSTTAKSAGISQTASTQWVGFMGAMLKSSGVAEQSAGNMSKSLVQLTGDMSSFYNVGTDDMWEKIRSGISGETEPLKELGINMSVANLQAYALAAGIKKPYDQMTQGEQTTLRYNYLMNVTKDAQGDFGRTLSTSFANQVRVAQMNLGTLGRSIGEGLLPMFNDGVTAFNNFLPAIQNGMTQGVAFIKNGIQTLGPIFVGIGQDIIHIAQNILPNFSSSGQSTGQVIMSLVKGGLTDLKGILDWVANHGELVRAALIGIGSAFAVFKTASTISSTFQAFNAGVQGLQTATGAVSNFGKAFTALNTAGPILGRLKGAFTAIFSFNPMLLLIIAGVAAFAAVVYLVIKNWGPIKAFFGNLWTSTKETFNAFWNWLKPFITTWGSVILAVLLPFIGIPLLIVQHWRQIKSFFGNLWSGIKQGASSGLNGLGQFVTGIGNAIKNGVNSFATGVKNTVTSMGNSIKSLFTNAWNGARSIVLGIVESIATTIMTRFGWVITNIRTIFSALRAIFTSIVSIMRTVFLAPILLICDLIVGIFTGNFRKLGQDLRSIITSIVTNITTIFRSLILIFTVIGNTITSLLTMAWIKIKFTALQLCNELVLGLRLLWINFVSFITGLWNSIVTTATTMWNILKTTVINLVNALVQGAINIFHNIINFFVSLPGTLLSLATAAFNAVKNAFISIGTSAVNGAINIFNGVVNFFMNLPGRLFSLAVSAFNAVKSGAQSALNGLGSIISSGFNSAISFITSLPGKAFTWGSDFIQGIVKGIKSAVGSVVDAVSGVADRIRSFLHFSVPDEGPLADADTYGSDFMDLIATGIDKGKVKVSNAVNSIAGIMNKGIKVGSNLGVGNITSGISNLTQKISSGVNSLGSSNQPIVIQLMLSNGKALAEFLLPDLDNLQGQQIKLRARRQGL